ncbi:MAG: hypothetical protein AABY15_06570 [Nanoarchaeota archaeon]
MSWHPNSNKHKREHGGYKGKPTRKDVNALMDFYSILSTKTTTTPVKKQEGVQLKLFNS